MINYYGEKDNYIHLKFGDCIKAYNFTKDFIKEYPLFIQAYKEYFMGKSRAFNNALQVINYIYNNEIPVHLYFNFTDTPVKDREEAVAYFIRENDKSEIYEWELNKPQ